MLPAAAAAEMPSFVVVALLAHNFGSRPKNNTSLHRIALHRIGTTRHHVKRTIGNNAYSLLAYRKKPQMKLIPRIVPGNLFNLALFACVGKQIRDEECHCPEVSDDVGAHIMSFLDVSDVVRSKRVNKQWQRFCQMAIQANFQPQDNYYFYGRHTLRDMVLIYCNYHKDDIDKIGRTYGYPINKWSVVCVEKFDSLFAFCGNFNEYIGDWDVSNAKAMVGTFWGARSFNKPLEKWRTSQVTDMHRTFEKASSFNQKLDTWDTSQVKTM